MVDVYVLFIIWLTTVLSVLIIVSPSSGHLETNLETNELASIQYGIDISDKPLILDDDVDVVLSSKYGQLYRCSFSSALKAEKNRRQQENENFEEKTSVTDLLKPLETSPCLVHTAHWWTYELCYKKELKQYHIEEGKITGDIMILGLFKSEFDWFAEDVNSSLEAKQRYHSQYYENGSLCDLTGNQREAEIHVVCDPKATFDYIVRVEEPITCGYLVTVRTNRVCGHKMLNQPEEKHVVPIMCHPALSQAELDRYSLRHSATVPEPDVLSSNNVGLRKQNILFPTESFINDDQITTEKSEVVEIPVQQNDAQENGENVNHGEHELSFGGITVRLKVHHHSDNGEMTQQDADTSQSTDQSRTDTDEAETMSNPIFDRKTENKMSTSEEGSPPPERAEIRILNAAYYDEDGRPVGKYEQNSETTLDQMVMAVMGTNAEEIAEYESHRRLQDNYGFTWSDSDESEHDQKQSPNNLEDV